MNLILQRYSDNGQSTQGIMLLSSNNKLDFLSYSLEDEHRTVKVIGETCIPSGLYEVKFRKILTEKTQRYRNKYSWFEWHLELQDVEGFKYIYMHVGNTDNDTQGCILVQDNANNNQVTDGFNSSSAPAFERLYMMCAAALLNEEKIFIRIKDVKDLA